MYDVLHPTPSACWRNAGLKAQQESVFSKVALEAAVKCADGGGVT
jgi:hypothetical protein